MVLLAMLGSLVGFPASAAAASPGDLVVSGTGSGSARLDLAAPVTIPCCAYDFMGAGQNPRVEITGFTFEAATTPTYVGFALQRVDDGSIVVGAVDVVAMGLETMTALAQIKKADAPVPAGSYILHLLSDVPVTLRIQASGLAEDVVVNVSEHQAVSASMFDLQPSVGGADASLEGRRTVELGTDAALLIQVIRHEASEVVAYSRTQQCLRQNNDPCETVQRRATGAAGPMVATAAGRVLSSVYTRDSTLAIPAPGTSEAVFSAQAVAARNEATGFLLILEMPPPLVAG